LSFLFVSSFCELAPQTDETCSIAMLDTGYWKLVEGPVFSGDKAKKGFFTK